jgi:YD repeat-containing protein
LLSFSRIPFTGDVVVHNTRRKEMRVRLRGQRDFSPILPALFRTLALAILIAAMCLPALPQAVPGEDGNGVETGTGTGTGTGTTGATPTSVTCSVPGNGTNGVSGTGTTNGNGVQVTCSSAAGVSTQQNLEFSVEATVPLNFVIAAQPPLLPPALFSALSLGEAELRQFIQLSGNVLTSNLIAVAAGTQFPTLSTPALPGGTATLAMPTGTLINQVRIRVQNITVTGGLHPTMLFSGTVIPPTDETGTTGTQAAELPNLWGTLNSNAASLSLAFFTSFPFPGLTEEENGPFGTSEPTQVSFVSLSVAGAFVWVAPNGFASVDISTAGAAGQPGPLNFPVIAISPVDLRTLSRTIALDASRSFSPTGSQLTFTWTSAGQVVSITNANTPTPIITFPAPGIYPVQLTVTDPSGVQSSVTLPFEFVGF